MERTSVTRSVDLLSSIGASNERTAVLSDLPSSPEHTGRPWYDVSGEEHTASRGRWFEPTTGGTLTVQEIRSAVATEWSEFSGRRSSVNDAAACCDQELKAAQDRAVLLARKYVRKSIPEDDARRTLLTERLRQLVPRVTDEDLDRLVEIGSFLNDLE